jgi:hypothetical protein
MPGGAVRVKGERRGFRFAVGVFWQHGGMRAELWRDSLYVGFFVVASGGKVTEDFTPSQRDRIEPILVEIQEKLSDPQAWESNGGQPPEPGDRRWFDRMLQELETKGYEHRVLEDDGFGRDGVAERN